MTVNLLPLELVYEIIDFLAALHPRSLRAGSLVCHAWLSRIRPILFSTITLRKKNIVAFIEILRSPNDCSFLPLIRRINAHRLIGDAFDLYFDAVSNDLRTSAHIHTLEMNLLMSVHGTALLADKAFRTGFVTAFPQLNTLELVCGFWPLHTDAVIDMICLFPELEVLQLTDIIGGLVVDIPDTATPPQKLRSVILGAGAAELILTWFIEAGVPPLLDSLTLSAARPTDTLPVSQTLQRYGRMLRHIDIVISPFHRFTGMVRISLYRIVDTLSIFNLSWVPNLKTLTIRDLTARPTSEEFIALITLTAPVLERLYCEIDISFHQREDWEIMDAFLSRERFPLLNQVTLPVAHPSECRRATRVFPLLHAAGLLRAEWRGY
ncbi:hypothetical protein R3P38DRAFT_3306790 [Favolaschia claudopus]|uniref:F-box domain-containing protein n=1 Tax=Favolaschia claudopus TaxID=2862362 RepID=A0AAW0DCH8_9AGAR